MNISQSLMNSILDPLCCPQAIKLEYVDRLRSEPSDVMQRGHYFEYLIIGGSSAEKIPELPKLKKGRKSQAEKDIDDLATIAKGIMVTLGINLESAMVQERIEIDGESGLFDLVTNDFQKKGRKAIYDVKYTETKYDDRFNGWADIDSRPHSKRQARHYIRMWQKIHGEYLPYYFLIFGKSGWCRIIKCEVTEDSMAFHDAEIGVVKVMLDNFKNSKYKPTPTYEKCRSCRMAEFCDHYLSTPDVEVVQI